MKRLVLKRALLVASRQGGNFGSARRRIAVAWERTIGRLDRLHRLFAVSALIQAAGLLITFGLGIMLARLLQPAAYGRYGLVMAAISIAAVPATFGLPHLAMREAAANANASGKRIWEMVRAFLGRTCVAALITGALLALLIIVAPGPWVGDGLSLPMLTGAIVIGGALLTTCSYLLRGFGWTFASQTLDLLLRPAMTLTILLALSWGGAVSIHMALGSQLGAVTICLLLGLLYLHRTAKASGSDDRSPYRLSSWLAPAMAFMSHAILGTLNGNYPLLTASPFVSDTDMGVLRVALAAAALLYMPLTVANLAAGPLVARQFAAGGQDGLADTLSRTTVVAFCTTALGLLLFALAGRQMIQLMFGAAYASAYVPMLVLGLAQLLLSAFGIGPMFLNMSHREGLVLRGFLVSVPAGIVSSLPLSAMFGITGTAASTVLLTGIWQLYVYGQHRGQVDVPTSIVAAVRYLMAKRSAPTPINL